jgi:FtsP/CotA-like multicopper oxidase with cupredoxin domain
MYPHVRQPRTRWPRFEHQPEPRLKTRAHLQPAVSTTRERAPQPVGPTRYWNLVPARKLAQLLLAVGLLTAAALLALLAGPHSSRSSTTDGDPYRAPAVVDTNPSPKIVETTITATPATVDIGQGVKAHALTFNGSIPGPTFRLDVGDTAIVHFRNQLGEETGIHWHGVEVANAIDGTPVTHNQVKPGGTFRYQFTVTRPGVYWYHPHHHGSNNQVFKGMYGMIVVRDPLERLPEVNDLLPPPDRTLRIALGDTTVCKAPGSNDAVTYAPGLPHVSGGPLPAQGPPTPKDLCETHPVDVHGMPRAPFAAGDIPNIQQADALANPTNEGQTVLTNGVNVGARTGTPENPGVLVPGAKTFPVIGNQQVRLQLVNASTTRYVRLRLTTPSGAQSTLLRIGGEGGLLDKSRIEGGLQGTFSYDTQYTRGEIVLPPGGRADVLARMRQGSFGGQPPEVGVYTLWTEDYLRSATKFAGLPTVPVMHFQVSPPATNTFDGILFSNTPIRPAFDPVETLSATVFTPLDPAGFPTPKPGLASPQIGLTVDAAGFGIDGVHGAHDHGDDFMRAPHAPSTRYLQPGRTYTLSVANQTASRHPFHLHGFSIQPLDLTRAGHSVPIYTFDYHEFVDTIDIPPGHILRYRVRIDRRPLAGDADPTKGGELGRWVMHCHIFSHAEDGMISELVVTGNLLDHERPQITIDNVDITGIRGRTATASGTYADPDGDTVAFRVRDADTNETLGTITKDGTDHGRWTWTYPVTATDHDRRVKIQQFDDKLDFNQMVLDLHVEDPPTPTPTPTPTATPTPTGTPTPTPAPSGGQPQPQTTPPAADRTAPVIRGVRVKRLARATGVRVRLSERARLTVTIRRRGHRVARVSRAGVPGRNTLRVRKPLRPGCYAVIARAVDAAGNGARPVKVRLRIRRR